MTTLQARLDRIKAGFVKQASPEILEIVGRATEDVRASGILDRIPRVGTTLPAFELADTEGVAVRSSDLLARGPLILTFYRGDW